MTSLIRNPGSASSMNFNCLIKKSEQTISVMMYWATKNSLRDTTDPPLRLTERRETIGASRRYLMKGIKVVNKGSRNRIPLLSNKSKVLFVTNVNSI